MPPHPPPSFSCSGKIVMPGKLRTPASSLSSFAVSIRPRCQPRSSSSARILRGEIARRMLGRPLVADPGDPEHPPRESREDLPPGEHRPARGGVGRSHVAPSATTSATRVLRTQTAPSPISPRTGPPTNRQAARIDQTRRDGRRGVAEEECSVRGASLIGVLQEGGRHLVSCTFGHSSLRNGPLHRLLDDQVDDVLEPARRGEGPALALGAVAAVERLADERARPRPTRRPPRAPGGGTQQRLDQLGRGDGRGGRGRRSARRRGRTARHATWRPGAARGGRGSIGSPRAMLRRGRSAPGPGRGRRPSPPRRSSCRRRPRGTRASRSATTGGRPSRSSRRR